MAKSKLPFAEHVEVVPYGSKQANAAIEAGYQMTEAAAKDVRAQWDKLPGSIPWAEVLRADAMLDALNAKPSVTSTRPAWKRTRPQPGG